MATRSTISMEQPDGRIMTIYCHWDGYLDHHGRILTKYYTNRARVFALMLLGDLSTLGRELGPMPSCDVFNDSNYCDAYGRDRGEDDTQARVYADMQDYLSNVAFEEYNYIFLRDGQWYVDLDEGNGDFTTVADALKKLVDTSKH
jgi:hypothetical protein